MSQDKTLNLSTKMYKRLWRRALVNPEHEHKRDGAPLTDKLRVAIAQHLNQDHREDLLACVKANTDLDWAAQVRVINIDTTGIVLEVSGSGNVEIRRFDFPVPAAGVLALRRMLGAMIAESRAQLGWPVASDHH